MLWEYTGKEKVRGTFQSLPTSPGASLLSLKLLISQRRDRHRKVKWFSWPKKQKIKAGAGSGPSPPASTMLSDASLCLRLWLRPIVELIRLDTGQGNRFIV